MIWWFSDLFLDFPRSSSNLQISMVWTIFLQIIDNLFIRYDMIIFFSGNYSVFRFSLFFLNPLKIFVFYWFWPELNDDFYLYFYTFKAFIKVYFPHDFWPFPNWDISNLASKCKKGTGRRHFPVHRNVHTYRNSQK